MATRQERLEFEATDFYAALNLESSATEAQVRKSFRQLALQWHPDKHQGSERTRATDIFQQINKAHAILSDRQSRARYDAIWRETHRQKRAVPAWALKAGRSGSMEGPFTQHGKDPRVNINFTPRPRAPAKPAVSEPPAPGPAPVFRSVRPKDKPPQREADTDEEQKKRNMDLLKKEKERARAQAEWLWQTQAKPAARASAPSTQEARRASDSEQHERSLIEELRQSLAKQAEELAERAREIPRRFSDLTPAPAPPAPPAPEPEPEEPEPVVSRRSSVTSEASETSWSNDMAEKVASDVGKIAGEVGSSFSAWLGSMSSGWWSAPRPIREEAKPTPACCPRCSQMMPRCPGANFCPHCTFRVT